MSMVGVVARIEAKPGMRDDLVAALRTAVDNTADEPGTLTYILHADAAEADVLWMYELYADQSALDAHIASEGFKALGAALGSLLAGRPTLQMCTPLFGKGLPSV